VRGSLKMLLLLGAVGALIVLVARHGGEVTGLGDRDLASLVYNVGFLALVGGAVLRIFRDRLGEAIQAVLLWAVVALALIVAYTYRFDLKDGGAHARPRLSARANRRDRPCRRGRLPGRD
jgi:predicted aspartyl protease